MNYYFFFFRSAIIGFIILYSSGEIFGQLFNQLADGSLVETPSDSRSINCIDVNGDGWDDVFVSNGPSEGATNMLFLNNGDGTFTKVLNNPISEDTSAFDGATFADADNDGDLDAFVVTWYGLKNYFYRNTGEGIFEYEADNISGSEGTYSETAGWGDYNEDGYIDLYMTNSDGNKKNMMYKNLGDGGFEEIIEGAMITDAYYSRGLNWVDYDNDNDQDLFVCNESNQLNNLYRNDGEGQFTKIVDIAPVTGNYGSMSSSWGDVDNDGDLDLFIANSGYFNKQNNQLFINDGDGTFSEVADMEVVTDEACSYSSSFVDYDNDGDIDLFVSNGYCNGNIENFLYKNDGTGFFERDLEALPDYETPCSFGAAWADLDHNGFMDLVVSTCRNSLSSPLSGNLVFMNEGNANHYIKVRLQGLVSNRSALGAKIYVTAEVNGNLLTQMREINAQEGYCSQNSFTAHFGLGESFGPVNVEVKWPSGVLQVINTQSDTSLDVIESTATGIKNKKPKNIGIHVFPGNGGSNIHYLLSNPDQELVESISIFDAAGRNQGLQTIKNSRERIEGNIAIQPGRGLYVVRVKVDGEYFSHKFISK